MKLFNFFKQKSDNPFDIKEGTTEAKLLNAIFEAYKKSMSRLGVQALDHNTGFVVKAINSVIENKDSQFNIRGGEFPSSLFSQDEVVNSIENIPDEDIINNRFGIFGGAYFCIGELKETKDGDKYFEPSKFLIKILKKNVPYKVREVFDSNETYYDAHLKIVHHPFTEQHFRLLQNGNGSYECMTHSHHPKTGERLFLTPKYNDDPILLKHTGRSLIDFFKQKTKQVLEDNDANYVDVKSLLEQYYKLPEENKNIKERFIVDVGKTKYEMATDEQIGDFLKTLGNLFNVNKVSA